MSYTREQIEAAVKTKGYKWFEDRHNKGYDVNIVGVRNSDTANKVTNRFDDKITVSYKKNGKWKFFCFDCTTDPGTHWVKNIMSKRGVAILKPGQYRSSHKIRLHQGKYEALGQQKPVKVYRDGNLDEVYDTDEATIKEGIYGINIHRSNPHTESYYINKWSAGCQVFKRIADYDTFMEICHKAKDVWGNSFTYTLLNSSDLS